MDSQREGMLDGFTLGNYLMLVEHTGRMLREGKATITAEGSGHLGTDRSSAEAWQSCMLRLRGGRLLGRFIAGSRELLRSTAEQLGVKRLVNLSAVSTA